jgi:pimeloyl-ACP methyl ester carboxylesterase
LPDDGMVDVGGGVSLHVHCVGEGSPMVLLDECLGCQVPMYRPIWAAIGRFTRACGYDRAGVGYGTPAAKPHLARQIVGELRALLGDRDQAGDVVLVGHGLGGLLVQLYARAFPRSVAGMVLVDPQTKDYDSRYYALFPPEAREAQKADLNTTPENLDGDDVFGAMAELRRVPLSLGDRPLVLVTRGKPRQPLFDIPADRWNTLEATWRAMEEDVTSLSTNSAHIVAPEAGWIPEDAPDRVVAAAWQVVSAVRSGVPLSRLPATAPPAAPPSAATPALAPTATPVPDDGIVDMGGGTSLHLHCVGHGTPTVVIDNGHGADGGSWGLVLGDFGRTTRTCVYDRLGIGFSSGPAPRHHTNRQMADELQALLQRAAIPGPYVLVAHSMGGVNVRLLQAEHPDEVVGMVLVDVTTEDEPPVKNADEIRALMQDDVEGIDYDTMLASMEDLRRSAARSLGDMPLVVLSANGKEPLPPQFALEEEPEFRRQWLAGHERVSHLSTNSAHVIADHSGHFIQIDAPQLVAASVAQVVQAVRTHGRVDGKALEPLSHAGPYPPRE